MRVSRWIVSEVFCLILGLVIGACSDEDKDLPVSKVEWQTRKVAVVLPMDNGLDRHWKRTLQWLNENLRTAFSNQEEGIALEFEWYDENASSLRETAEALSAREDIVAVIGGRSSASANLLAKALSQRGKPLFTLATSEELVRAFSQGEGLWAMTETDVSQCEVLLTRAIYYNAKQVALIADGTSFYGKTFVDWFAFQARELGLGVKAVCDYSRLSIEEACSEAFASETDYVICVPSDKADMRRILRSHLRYTEENGSAPRLLFSDVGYGSDVINELGELVEGVEGVSYCSDPESGFDVSYEVYYDEQVTLGEAQVYDAGMLIAFAAYKQLIDPQLDFTMAMRNLVDGREEGYASWRASDMQEVVNALTQGGSPNIQGASGSLDFDSKVYTNVLHTIYHNYRVYNGQYIILDHSMSDGSKRVGKTLAGWNWKISQTQEFETPQKPLVYPSLDKRWALLIATSEGWANYRHQADVLAMYRLLKANGYTDDRIILIMEDDLAYNKLNPTPGFISTLPNGENMYKDVHIDYHVSDLSPTDIRRILLGERSERLREVIDADSDDNVFMFWSGHGSYGQLNWLDEMEGFSAGLARQTFQIMHEKQRYRKLLCCIEACYSGSVMREIEGVEGILAITAASPFETSKADVYNPMLHVWMSNRFTSSLIESITKQPGLSLRDLYNQLARQTVGSHATVYNAEYYGNMYTNTMDEFINYKH